MTSFEVVSDRRRNLDDVTDRRMITGVWDFYVGFAQELWGNLRKWRY